MEPSIRYTQTSDGVSIAYWTLGEGRVPLIMSAPLGWSHISLEHRFPELGAWYERLAAARLLVRYDERNQGISQRGIREMSEADFARDVEAVLEHLGLDQADLWALTGSAPPLLRFAAEHSDVVRRLVLWDPYLCGRDELSHPRMLTLIGLIESDWELFTETYAGNTLGWSGDEAHEFARFIRSSVTQEDAARMFAAVSEMDATQWLERVSAPTLVVHAGAQSEGAQQTAAGIPNARLVELGRDDLPFRSETGTRAIEEFLDEADNTDGEPRAGEQGGAAVAKVTRVAASEGRSFANGRYVVKRLLGQGAQKSVYLVDDTVLRRQCALSMLNAALLDPSDVDRIKREAQTMAQFGAQSNIVTVYDYGEEDGTPFIVCEYVPGGELREELAAAAGPLPLDRALTVAMDICRALSFAHRRDIVHRDLKPENVWLTEERSAKLGDFGIALSIGRTRLTMPGGITGTAAYMAPEQVSGGDVDARSDLYAFGVLLYELVTGHPPFVGDDPNAIMYQHVNSKPESPVEHNASVPPSLERLIMRLLAKTKAERPGSAQEVLAELERAAAEFAGGLADVHTILFTDMASSTTLADRLGDAAAQEVRRTHNEIVRTALSANGGNEIKHTGDGIMASFGTASAALQTAIAIQRGVAQHKQERPDSPLRVYVGLNAGEPIAEGDPEGRIDLFGTSVNLAARICEHANAGQIVAADVVRQLAAGKQFLFSDLGETELRGFEDPVKLWELRWEEAES